MNKDVVGCNAGLPAIDELTPDEIFCSELHVGRLVHNGWRFPAQLQGDAGQMLRGGCHHELADGGRAGEENMIKRHLKQGLRGGLTAFKVSDF